MSSIRVLQDLSEPSRPESVSAAANGSTVTISWGDAVGAPRISHYVIYRNGVQIATDTNSPYDDEGLTNGDYVYSVSAVDANGREGEALAASQVTVAVVPPHPDVAINFLASAVSATGINLSWARGPIDPAPTDYDLDFATAGASGPWTNIAAVGLQTTYAHTALTTATQYWYRLLAINAGTPAEGYATVTETTDAASSVGAANFIIPAGTGQVTWDGDVARVPQEGGAARKVRPGDIVEFAAGTHGERIIEIRQGTAAQRVTLRGPQTSGRAIINPSNVPQFWMTLRACKYLDINGLAPNNTDCPVNPDGFRRSIKLIGHGDFIQLIKCKASGGATFDLTSFTKICGIEIDGGTSTFPNGIGGAGIGTNDASVLEADYPAGTYQEELEICYNYVYNCKSSAMYLGPNTYKYTRTNMDPEVPCKGFRVHHNYIADIGGRGILCKTWFGGTPGADGVGENSIHDNFLVRCGMNTHSSNDGRQAMDILSCKTNVYNNYIELCGNRGINFSVTEGTNVGDPSGDFGCRIYNNVVHKTNQVDSGTAGISCQKLNSASPPAPVCRVYNNTVAQIGSGAAILFDTGANGVSNSSFIRNNVCIETGGITYGNATSEASKNLTAGTAASVFVDVVGTHEAGTNNLRLQAASAANGSIGTDIAATDIVGVSRPQGGSSDKGAYEFP